ncbi:CvpA family protein [Oceanirhabdus seepicola]|uniref:CvpA family protein n=1 Tax=Oceanirhabdus seepicola TaxID=2828781 RepID=A0A9J6PA15_9CLOT|nr:CvpA family protein [Oceanirhabdus seepicola]MCM1992609.1 CvpA family protein [Oceanirhabdus seepicola]
MNIIDIVLILVIIVAITIGYCRGFLSSIVKIVAFIGAIVASRVFHGEAVGILKNVEIVKEFVDTGVNMIIDKLGFNGIANLSSDALDKLDTLQLNGGEISWIQSSINTLKTFIGDSWMTNSASVGDALGELLYSIIAYIVLLFGTFIVILIIGNIIVKIIHASTLLKGTDMLLGAAFTGGLATILLFITVKISLPFLMVINNEAFVKALTESRVVEFIMNFLS